MKARHPLKNSNCRGAEGVEHCPPGRLAACGLGEHHRGASEDRILELVSRTRPGSDGCGKLREARIDRGYVSLPRRRAPEETQDLVDRLGRCGRVASGVAVALTQQEPDVADDAVARRAEAGQPDEEPLLEHGGHRVVEIPGLGESPQLLNELRRSLGRLEEVRQDSETTSHLHFEGAARCPTVFHVCVL